MTQPYGQQPGQQPGNYPQGGGGYPQAPQPPQPSYQQGFGGMPQAPQEYGGGPVARPGVTTTGSVLAFVQGGLTLITSAILMIALAAVQDLANRAEDVSAGGIDVSGTLGLLWAVSVVQLVGVVLLIWGGVKFLSGTGNVLFLVANGLQIVLCIFWFSQASPFVPVVLLVMPILGFVFALGSANKQYVQHRTTGRMA